MYDKFNFRMIQTGTIANIFISFECMVMNRGCTTSVMQAVVNKVKSQDELTWLFTQPTSQLYTSSIYVGKINNSG